MPAIHWGFMTRQDESGNGSAGQPPPWAVLTAEQFTTCQLEWAAAEPPPARRGRPSPPAGERSTAGPAAGPWNVVALGDCRDVLPMVRSESVDTIFADPPYNLQLKKALIRPNQTLVESVDAEWDQFNTFQDYDRFTYQWLKACHRVLKPTGAIWVMGTYHNIYRIGRLLQDLGFWILNEVCWIKTNPMPNFRGSRFTNAHETLIWAKKSETAKGYTFNYQDMKAANGGKQMRSDWVLPICTGKERLRDEHGRKAHPTQKPEGVLERVIAASTQPGQLILDPFAGTGTTAAVAARLNRRWLMIEREPEYVELMRARLTAPLGPPQPPPHQGR